MNDSEPSRAAGRSLGVLDELHQTARRHGAAPVLVLLPEIRDLSDPEQTRTFHRMADRLQTFSTGRRMPFLNLYPVFERQGQGNLERLFLSESWYHYSAAGNRLVAEQIDTFLRQSGLTGGSSESLQATGGVDADAPIGRDAP